MVKLNVKVAIIGCGKVGGEISKNLITKKYIDELLLFDKFQTSAENLAKLLNGKARVISNLSETEEAKYIVITLSAMGAAQRKASFMNNNSTYGMRHDELKANISALKEIVPRLQSLSHNIEIIVVSNPVEELVSYLHSCLKGRNILSFGLSLDVARYSKGLNRKVICIGEHGRAIPLLNLSSEQEYKKLHDKIDLSVVKFVQTKGMTYEVTGKEFAKTLDNLNSSKKSVVFLAKYLDSDVFGVSDVVASLPFEVKKGKILSISKVHPSSIEIKMFREQAAEFKKSFEAINFDTKILANH